MRVTSEPVSKKNAERMRLYQLIAEKCHRKVRISSAPISETLTQIGKSGGGPAHFPAASLAFPSERSAWKTGPVGPNICFAISPISVASSVS